RHREVLGEGALAVHAQDLEAVADVHAVAAALHAVAAGQVALDRDAVPGPEARHVAADLDHLARGLVPEDQGRLDGGPRPVVPGPDVDVGAADGRGPHAE